MTISDKMCIRDRIHNFIWCTYWIFPTEKKSNTWRQVLLFSIAFGMSYVAQFLFLIWLVEGLDCNEYPVSYTHLDVYKRQDVGCVQVRT